MAEQAAFGLPVVIPPQYPAEDFPNDPTHGVVHGECAPAADEGVPEGVNDNPLIPGVLPVIEGLPDVDSPEPSECGMYKISDTIIKQLTSLLKVKNTAFFIFFF